MKFILEKKSPFFFFLVALALSFVLVIFYFNTQKAKSTGYLVEHAEEVLRTSDNVLLDVLNIETGFRGYIISGNELFLEPFNKGVNAIDGRLSTLAMLTKNDLYQQVRVDSLKQITVERLALTRKGIEIMKLNKLNAIDKIVFTEKGKILTDKIRSIIAGINSKEFSLLSQIKRENEESNDSSDLIFLFVIVFLIVTFVLVIIIIRNQKIRNTISEELKQSTQFFSNLFNYNPASIAIHRVNDGKIINVNNSFLQIVGFTSKEEVIGKTFSELNVFVNPKYEEEIVELLKENEIVKDYESNIRTRNGEIKWTSASALFLKVDGSPCVFSVSVDITGKKNAEQHLVSVNKELEAFTTSQKSLSKYSLSLIEASLDPLVTINTEGKITDMNGALANITGMTREELTGTDFFDYFTEPQKAREVYQEVFAKGSVADSPLTLRHKDGKLTDVLFNGSVYKDDNGNVLGVVIVARDVTAQKLLSKYSLSLIEASLDPLVTISTKGKITDMNEALANITGMTRDELTGTDFFDYFTEPQKAREVYQEVFAKGSVADSPLTLRHNDGKLTDVLFNGSVYKDDRGNVLGAVVVARDIAEQKWAIELRIANKELAFQNDEKEKRAQELSIANKELAFQNDEKEKRAAELSIANKELAFQNDEKEKRAAELGVANKELAFQNDEKEKRAQELSVANKELAFQNDEKEKRAAELSIANKELAFQNDEKEKRAAELGVANKELAFQNDEKEKRAAELGVANKELAFQNDEKEKRAQELSIANKELAFQNDEKEKRAAELFIANKELVFQTGEKEKRAQELVIADIELDFQNKEKEKREIANKELEALSYSAKLASQYSLSLIEASLDPLVTISTEGKITDMNEATVNIIGMSREKLTGTDFFDYFTEPQKAREVYQEVFAKGSVADSPLTLRHKDGKLTDVLFNGSVYKDDKGNVLGVVIVARDVTAQKLLSKYSLSLIEASRDPLFTISPEGKITDMNQATVRVTGISREKLIGTDFFDYFTQPDKAREGYQQVFAKGFVADYPLTIMDGKFTDVLCNGSVYKDDRGNVLGVVIVARDITEQKRIATELTEAKVFAELATGIAEEAKGKAESATRIAEDAVKAKQQFLSNMSHEIRTPMNAIIGFTKVVLKTNLNIKQKEYINAIKVSGDALIVLINDILDLAKVDAGKMTFEQTPFKMSASISAMLHLFETKIQEKNLELVKEYDAAIPEVLVGDPVRLHQVILNLVSNAVKFTTNGQITVSVHLLKEDALTATIEFAITDTGIGIPEGKLGNIFDDFQQATSGTSRLYGGTGLGLAIVKQLVEPQGGIISVKSTVGIGSTFSFILTFKKTKVKAEMETDMGVELEAGIKNIKILVVEDIALNQLLMKTLLEEFGFDLELAGNGKIAIEKLQKNNYDIILMDLQMPEMNGFEATEYIRNEMNSDVPIIALTADVTTVDVEKCKAVGMNDYISKPIDEKLLYSKILKYLKKTDTNKVIDITEKQGIAELQEKCTNLNYLKKLTKNNSGMIEMIEVYLEETPLLINKMKQAIDNNDYESLRIAAHSIIPSFSIMGISKEYENMAREIQEYSSKKKDLNLINKLFPEMEKVCILACSELKVELALLKD